MIKLFRKIRQNLIMENRPTGQAGKTSKYFKYAIGEIVLVVIGILIAVQINDFNEDRKLQRLKSVYIDKLIIDLKTDIKRHTENNNSTNKNLEEGRYIIETILNNKPIDNKNEFIIKLQNVGRILFPEISKNTFLDLQTSGNLKLFSDDVFIESIRNYYQSENDFWKALYIQRTTEGVLPLVIDVLPFQVQEDIMRVEIEASKNNGDYQELLDLDLHLSDAQFTDIVNQLKSKEGFSFHLKNATRAHLLQITYNNAIVEKAKANILILEKMKSND